MKPNLALDVFNGRLLNIEEEIKLLKHSIQGTAQESDESIKCYLSKIHERIVNLEGNLHRLEDRMFANLDGAIDDETGFITLVMDPVDFQGLYAMNPTEIAQKLREKGSGWKIENIKLKPPKTADQKPQVLINFLTRDSEKHMRDHISEISELFGLEHGVFCLSPVYTLHVEHLVPHLGNNNNMGDKALEEALLKTLGVKDLKAKVTYDRMLLKTQSFDVVSRLCLTGVKIFDHYYQIVYAAALLQMLEDRPLQGGLHRQRHGVRAMLWYPRHEGLQDWLPAALALYDSSLREITSGSWGLM
ncbi:uncharacterized protein FSUBG_12103 [Fusarium subglutinans]|uniref:Uncharacterized protein n=1 Tax=Gibberella subglutinans TaxID=42677 RepID=A0A8H5L8D7_GIBSU|nr:uncharacterized protein FSUBG_12103 [Fusarium subglutinans]KAF5586593.1 hypothetical protein FSUBG_12103 [Fusarium subglutinans]